MLAGVTKRVSANRTREASAVPDPTVGVRDEVGDEMR